MSTLKTNFQAVPDAQELASLPRDLRFQSTQNPAPQLLTRQQIEQFNRDGFVKPLPVYRPSEISAIRSYFDTLLAKVVASGGDSYSISSAHLKYGPVWDILTNRTIVGYVSDILGDDVIGWGSHFFCKMPGDGKSVAWHQDASYWPLTPSRAVTVWLAIDDADVENACMRFIAGSHHHGQATFRPSDPKEHNVLNQTIENPEQFGTGIVDDELRAGEVSLHSDLLLHGSEANTSARRRCGLTLRYAAASVHAYMDWNQKGVYVRGTDSRQHWANRARPDTDF